MLKNVKYVIQNKYNVTYLYIRYDDTCQFFFFLKEGNVTEGAGKHFRKKMPPFPENDPSITSQQVHSTGFYFHSGYVRQVTGSETRGNTFPNDTCHS